VNESDNEITFEGDRMIIRSKNGGLSLNAPREPLKNDKELARAVLALLRAADARKKAKQSSAE